MKKILNSEGRPLGSFVENFPTPAALLDYLNSLGFQSEMAGAAPPDWASLKRPRSATLSTPTSEHFTYLNADFRGDLSPGWGLLLLDKKIASRFAAFPSISTLFPDAALDAILRKIVLPEWAGTSAPAPAQALIEGPVHIGPDCQIGEGTIIESGVRLGARVKIGKNCRIGAQSRIADDTVIGDDCVFTGQVSLGGPGFGFVYYPGSKARAQRIHLGRVILGDRVRLGAMVSVDRGVFEDTVLGHDVAVDNFVQIAHNCRVGDSSTLCGFVGLAGSTQLGKNNTFGGMVFTKGHLEVGDNVTIAGWSGIQGDVAANQLLKGYPLKPLNEALKHQVYVERIPELFDRVKKLEKKS